MGCTQPTLADLRYDFLVDIYKPIPNLPRTSDSEEDYFVFFWYSMLLEMPTGYSGAEVVKINGVCSTDPAVS
jgi:hypothetical protein